jgi:hypothetical protein
MNKRQKTALALFAIAIIALSLFPPFFAIDPTSEGRIHTSIGFHPAWAPPDEAYAHEVLAQEGFLPSEGLDVVSLEVRRNKVLMVFGLLLLLIGASVALFGFRTRRKDEA